jgi:hypothetical protein
MHSGAQVSIPVALKGEALGCLMLGTGSIKPSLLSLTEVNNRRLANGIIINTQAIDHWKFKNSILIINKHYISNLYIMRSAVE